jgi:hypothetical protein
MPMHRFGAPAPSISLACVSYSRGGGKRGRDTTGDLEQNAGSLIFVLMAPETAVAVIGGSTVKTVGITSNTILSLLLVMTPAYTQQQRVSGLVV